MVLADRTAAVRDDHLLAGVQACVRAANVGAVTSHGSGPRP